jgi:cyclopropane-fatty-acyl-phospholipid synthase
MPISESHPTGAVKTPQRILTDSGYTIRCWRTRFAVNRSAVLALTDERFCRMWEFYLSAVELEFLHGSKMVFQVLLSPKRDAVPIVRDFMLGQARQPAR